MNPFEHPIATAKLKELVWKIDREVWAKVEAKEATTSWGREQTAKLICEYFGCVESSPAEQDELWEELEDNCMGYDEGSGGFLVINEAKKRYRITRI